jgi:hypothetical protein
MLSFYIKNNAYDKKKLFLLKKTYNFHFIFIKCTHQFSNLQLIFYD